MVELGLIQASLSLSITYLQMEKIPRIGVGAIIVKDGKVLLGKRKNAHGEGSWSCPGGHLEFNEELEECAKREVLEETGIKIKNLKFDALTNDILTKDAKHYITIHMLCEHESGEVQNLEPHKCEKWGWFDWNNLPEPLFIPIRNLLKQNYNPIKK